MVQIRQVFPSSPPTPATQGSIYTDVTVEGGVSGQFAVGRNIVQIRGGHVLGNVVNVLPPGTAPSIAARPVPVRLLPRRPVPMVDRVDETAVVTAAAVAGRTVEIHAPAGAGKSTLLRHLSHGEQLGQACGGVAHLSARGLSRDDLLQAIFEVFYAGDVPVKPSPVELRYRLQGVRAALLLDDVDLTGDEVAELADVAPACGLVLAGERAHPEAGVRALALGGLPADAARELFGLDLGRALQPDELPAVDAVCGLVGAEPERVRQLAAAAAQHAGPLAGFAASILATGGPAVPLGAPDDLRLLELLAVVPGLELDAASLAEVSGLDDVPGRLDRLAARGLLSATVAVPAGGIPTPVTYGLAASLRAVASSWDLDQRRAELDGYLTRWALDRAGAVLPPGPQLAGLRAVHADAARRGAWGAVLALGVILDSAFGLSGRWDAWAEVARTSLVAARAAGDRRAEGLALHQLGTHALCTGDLRTAREVLSVALQLRRSLGDSDAVRVTAHNLSLITLPPPMPSSPRDHDGQPSGSGRHLVRRPPFAAKAVAVAAVLVPLTAVLAFVLTITGRAAADVDQPSLQFAAQPVHRASQPRSVVLANRGRASLRITAVTVAGDHRAEFVVTGSSCLRRAIPGGGSCVTSIVFSPAGTGPRRATVSWQVPQLDREPESALGGVGVRAAASTPAVAPPSLAFAAQPLTTSSEPRQVRLVAPGPGDVVLGTSSGQGVDAADFLLESDGCRHRKLVPGSRCSERIRFTPGAQGPRNALLTVTGPDGRPVATVPLSGVGVPRPADAPLLLDPVSLDFPDQMAGTTSPARSVRLANPGTTPQRVTGIAVLGTPDFTVVTGNCPATLAPGGECRLGVAFTPAGAGQRTAQLVIRSAGSPTVPLRGTGVAGVAAVDVAPDRLAFAPLRVGEQSGRKGVTVTNRGQGPVHVLGVDVLTAGGFRSDASGCTRRVLNPGASCSVAAWFAPGEPGEHTGVLDVAVEETPARVGVVLTGTATAPDLVVSSGPVLVTVPDVRGLPQADAEQALRGRRLVPGR